MVQGGRGAEHHPPQICKCVKRKDFKRPAIHQPAFFMRQNDQHSFKKEFLKIINGDPAVFLQRFFYTQFVGMTWKQVFTSSIGKKIVMSITGLSLILFLIVHVTVNACMWAVIFVPNDHGEVFNKAAHFLGQTLVPRVLEIGLFLFIILHIIQGYVLEVQNRSRRGTPYAMNYGNRGSKWYSRSMGLLGTLIFLFLILHIYDFWIPSRFGGRLNIHELGTIQYPDDPNTYHNLYGEMIMVFQNPFIVILYVLGCISLAYHLAHGFQSSFRTLGLTNKKYITLINGIGLAFSVIVSLAFAMMPISIYFHWIS